MAGGGEVVFVSRNQGMVVVGSDDGFVQVGDRAFGDWVASGGETIQVEKRAVDAYLQATCGTLDQAVARAGRTGCG